MGISIDFYDPAKLKRFSELRDKASKQLGKHATIQDMINLGYLKRVSMYE